MTRRQHMITKAKIRKQMIRVQEIITNKNIRQLIITRQNIIKDKIIYKKTRPINVGTTRRNNQKNVKSKYRTQIYYITRINIPNKSSHTPN